LGEQALNMSNVTDFVVILVVRRRGYHERKGMSVIERRLRLSNELARTMK
jgi:hypothetical protein